jgi:hypothetical protein
VTKTPVRSPDEGQSPLLDLIDSPMFKRSGALPRMCHTGRSNNREGFRPELGLLVPRQAE